MENISPGGVLMLRLVAAIMLLTLTLMPLYAGFSEVTLITAVSGIAAAGYMWWISMAPKRHQRFLAEAITGEATIRQVFLTGRQINNIPMLKYEVEVRAPGHQPYVTETNVMAYPGTVPNAGTVRCAISPKNPKEVKLIFDQAVPAGGAQSAQQIGIEQLGGHSMGQQITFSGSMQSNQPIQSASELLAKGTPAKAVVTQVQPSGQTTPEGDQIFVLVLDVTPSNGEAPFTAAIGHRVPQSALPLTAIGTKLSVAFDPADRNRRVAIDWEGSQAGRV